MYHCNIHFYFTGHKCREFKIIKEMLPLENFTHEFHESDRPKESMAGVADVIFVNLQNLNVEEALRLITSIKKKESELILIMNNENIGLVEDYLPEIKDIWTLPMSDSEIRFRFSRWQQAYKMSKDFWQTDQFLEAALNSTPNLIWYKDKNGIHEKVNDSFCRTVNKSKEMVQGQGHAYIWDVEHDDPACIESEREVMTKKNTFVSEEIITTGDGKRTLTTYKSPLYDIDRSVMGTVGVAIDVTREREYEKEIIQRNRALETIFTTIDCGLIQHTTDGKRLLRINKAALKILGYKSQDELEAEGFEMVAASVMDEDKKILRDAIQSLKKVGDSVSVEYRVQHSDGEILHVMGNIKLLMQNGKPVYQRFLLDCTAQKLQEKKNERRYLEWVQALSIDYNLVCYFDLDTGMGFSLQNSNNEEYWQDIGFNGKISLKESMERYIEEYVYEDDREMLRQAASLEQIKKELNKKKIYYSNYRAVLNGKTKYYQIKVVRAGTWDSNYGIVLGIRNVDEEIRNEMEQKNLLEDALLQANKASRAKSVFLSNMSHDIRTPMNAIVGFTNLAIARIDNKEQVREYLGKIMTSGNHLLNLINDVLDMSHIESGKIQLEEAPCTLSDIVKGLFNILQADINAKNMELHIDCIDVVNDDIYCDKLRLNQVLLNLLSNSVKYTGEGGIVSMQITQKPGASDGYANYEFCIKDNGIGMSEEFVSRIFEPFEREKNSTTSGIQGTGLGMAITKNIVDMMNGTINVKSKQGVGSEFILIFTFRICSEAKEQQEKAIEKTKKIRTGRILLAEDVELNQEIASAILEDAGFTTEIADNGEMAVDMLKKSEPGYYQLILMDVQMPIMNGYEATKAIRSLEDKNLSNIPIIAMTANAFEEDKKEALQCGMNAHIAKPIDVKNLFDTLDRIL